MSRPVSRITLQDVAREAGVSLATADRVLNGRSGVRGPTAERVRDAVARLGYRPNAAAARLALLPAALAAHEMRRSIGLDGISFWEGVYLALFIPLFAWIAFGFATAAIGFLYKKRASISALRRFSARRSSSLMPPHTPAS